MGTKFKLDVGTTPTSVEERQLLRAGGFVHVTGLVAVNDTFNPPARYRIGEQPLSESDRGRFDSNNSMTVVVTTGGEIWLATYTGPEYHERWQPLYERFCPNGRGATVPCSNGETIGFFDLMRRVGDPDWMPEADASVGS